MKKFKDIQTNILKIVTSSDLSNKDKQDILNYLFWQLCWDFDLDYYSISLVDIPNFITIKNERR